MSRRCKKPTSYAVDFNEESGDSDLTESSDTDADLNFGRFTEAGKSRRKLRLSEVTKRIKTDPNDSSDDKESKKESPTSKKSPATPTEVKQKSVVATSSASYDDSSDSDIGEEIIDKNNFRPDLSVATLQENRRLVAIDETNILDRYPEALLPDFILDFIEKLSKENPPSKCIRCEFTHEDPLQLAVHAFKHKVYICQICYKSFTDLKLFLAHAMSHTLEYGHYCSVCKVSKLKRGVEIHIKSNHKGDASAKVLKCDFQVKHSVLYGYVCISCGYIQLTKALADHHISNRSECEAVAKINMAKLIMRRSQNSDLKKFLKTLFRKEVHVVVKTEEKNTGIEEPGKKTNAGSVQEKGSDGTTEKTNKDCQEQPKIDEFIKANAKPTEKNRKHKSSAKDKGRTKKNRGSETVGRRKSKRDVEAEDSEIEVLEVKKSLKTLKQLIDVDDGCKATPESRSSDRRKTSRRRSGESLGTRSQRANEDSRAPSVGKRVESKATKDNAAKANMEEAKRATKRRIRCPKCNVVDEYDLNSLRLHLCEHFNVNPLLEGANVGKNPKKKQKHCENASKTSPSMAEIVKMAKDAFAAAISFNSGDETPIEFPSKSEPSSSEKSFECSLCYRPLVGTTAIKNHLRNVHFLRYKCGVCRQCFRFEFSTVQHHKKNHSGVPVIDVNDQFTEADVESVMNSIIASAGRVAATTPKSVRSSRRKDDQAIENLRVRYGPSSRIIDLAEFKETVDSEAFVSVKKLDDVVRHFFVDPR